MMKGALAVILVIFEVLGLIITVVERQDKIRYGGKKLYRNFKKWRNSK